MQPVDSQISIDKLNGRDLREITDFKGYAPYKAVGHRAYNVTRYKEKPRRINPTGFQKGFRRVFMLPS